MKIRDLYLKLLPILITVTIGSIIVYRIWEIVK